MALPCFVLICIDNSILHHKRHKAVILVGDTQSPLQIAVRHECPELPIDLLEPGEHSAVLIEVIAMVIDVRPPSSDVLPGR